MFYCSMRDLTRHWHDEINYLIGALHTSNLSQFRDLVNREPLKIIFPEEFENGMSFPLAFLWASSSEYPIYLLESPCFSLCPVSKGKLILELFSQVKYIASIYFSSQMKASTYLKGFQALLTCAFSPSTIHCLHSEGSYNQGGIGSLLFERSTVWVILQEKKKFHMDVQRFPQVLGASHFPDVYIPPFHH